MRRLAWLGLFVHLAVGAVWSGVGGELPAAERQWPMVDGRGGPDAFGYTWLDSDTSCPGAPVYQWRDIRSVGTRVTGLHDDNAVGPIPVGFDFRFYWHRYSQVYVGSNGYIAFDDDYNNSFAFLDIPNTKRGNNKISALEADYNFTGLAAGRGCWYWTNSARDSFIVQYESVPFTGQSTSRNSFQFILTKADSSITVQYRVQTGVPPGSPSGWNVYNDVIGIENITGLVGLRYLYGGEPSGNIPHAGLAIRFRPPATSSYSIRDMMVKQVISRNSPGVIMGYPAVQPLAVLARFKNSGTQAVASDSVYAEVRNSAGSVVWSSAGRLGALGVGAETTYSFGTWSPASLGSFALKVKSILSGDGFAGNDSEMVEIRVIDYSLTATTFGWDSATAGDFSLCTDYHALAVKVTPPTYPVAIDQIRVCFAAAAGNLVDYTVWDDDGPAGAPGKVLRAVRASVPGPGWQSSTFTPVIVPSGSFYVGYSTATRTGPNIATDTLKPLSRSNWERQVDSTNWYYWRWNQDREFRIRCRLGPAPGTRNVGVTAVVRPAGGPLDSGTSVVPVARVRNFGQQTETFSVTMRVNSNPAYLQTRSKSLAAGIEDTVNFAAWTARPGYAMVARCSVYLAQDQNRADDTLSGAPFDVYYRDVRPVSIVRPRDTVDAGTQVVPCVTLRNQGNTAENIPVRLTIAGTSYDDTVTLHLGAGATDSVRFPSWTVVPGASSARCSTMLPNDMVRANDLVTAPLAVRVQDVQAVAIVAPVSTVDSGVAVIPIGRVRNNGTGQVTFNVRMRVTGETYSQVRSKTLAAGATDTVRFPAWTPRIRGTRAVVCSTAFAQDRVPANDRVSSSVDVAVRDVGVVAILQPDDTVREGLPVTPTSVVRNYGNTTEDIQVRFRIAGASYDQTLSLRLAGGAVDTVMFPDWQPDAGMYTARCSTMLASDMNRANDRTTLPVLVVRDDVAAEAVLAPTGAIDSGTTVVPLVRVRNNNVLPAVCLVRLRIEEEGYNQVRQKALSAGASDTVAFPAWVGLIRGHHIVRCSVEYTLDQDPTNDLATELVDVVVHDVGTAAILAPVGAVGAKASVVPSARIRNHGTARESFGVRFEISDGYTRSQAVVDLGPGEERVVSFESWTAPQLGTYRVRCSTMLATDAGRANDLCIDSVRVGVDWPYGWLEVAAMPAEPSGRAVRHGGWIACDAGSQLVYAAKGNKTGDFYRYEPYSDIWTRLALIPSTDEGRMPNKGSVGCADGQGRVYATTGANTSAFWCYSAGLDTWERLPDVPREPGGGKVKGGTDMEFAVVADTGFVYLLKGFKDDFLRYNTVTRAWQVLPGPQTGSNRRWQRGSWLAYDSAGKFFAHKARCHELLKYDVAVNAWGAAPLPGMPRASSITGRRKKSKDGSDGDCHAGAIYALKGGNTQEFWKYSLAGDSWQELDTMPAGGSTGRRKRVWYGGDLASFGVGVFFALKGNKTLECWRYVERPVMGITSRPERDGVAATRAPARAAMVLSPNPVTGGRLALTIAGQVSGEGRVSVFDAAGRKRLCRREAMGSAGRLVLDVDRLPSGWYVLRFELGSTVTMHKFAVQAAGGSSPSR